MNDFNSHLANKYYGVDNEKDLRDKLYGLRTDLTDPEHEIILSYLEKFDSPRYCEIGVYFAGNFKKVNDWLSKNKKDFHMFGVDLFEQLASQDSNIQTHDLYNKWNILNVAYKDDLHAALKDFGCDKFSLHMGSSDKTVKTISEKCDVFFIDGNHTFDQTLLDAEACIEMSKPGTILIFHNASNSIQPDPQYVERDGGPWAVCNLLKQMPNIEYIELVDRCAVLKVKG